MQNETSFLTLLPGYIISRSDIAARRDLDAKQRHSSWLDGVGEMLFIDAERAFVIPAQELAYVSAEQIRASRLPRLVKIVASEDAGVACTFSAHVGTSWLKTFAKISVPKDSVIERHFVKAFAPTHQGAVVGYHTMRMNDGQLSWRSFEQVNGQQLRDLDFVSYEGKVHFAATTMMNDKSSLFVREAGIKALKDNQAVNASWTPAAFAEGHQLSNVRGVLKDGARLYTFLDTEHGTLCQAQPTDKAPKVIKKGIKGVINHVSGSMMDKTFVGTIVTEDKIIRIGKDEHVVAELSQHPELARLVRDSKWVNGIVARSGVVYLTSATNPLASLVTAQLSR